VLKRTLVSKGGSLMVGSGRKIELLPEQIGTPFYTKSSALHKRNSIGLKYNKILEDSEGI